MLIGIVPLAMRRRIWILVFILLLSMGALYARNVRIYGYVVDSDNRGIELANVVSIQDAGLRTPDKRLNSADSETSETNVISPSSFIFDLSSQQEGTTTNRNGYYELVLMEPSDTITLVYSMIGYTTVYQRIVSPQEVLNVNVEMATSEEWLEEVEVRGVKRQTTMMDHIDAGASRVMPDATGGSIESLLITFAGVNQNNELSSQYNVRGGSFDENVVYVNGIEVHRPLLIRSGQQEGLSFVNPSMVENVEFSAGGYGAQYGDKMASVLDIRYKRPERFEGSLSASLLGASVYVGMGTDKGARSKDKRLNSADSENSQTKVISPSSCVLHPSSYRFSQMHGIRYKTSQYMLGSLATAGNYQPNYFDYQTMLTWDINRDKGTRIKDKRQNSSVDEGARIKDERLNSADSETSETKVISPSSCVLYPLSVMICIFSCVWSQR